MTEEFIITEGMSPALKARQEKKRAARQLVIDAQAAIAPDFEKASRVREQLKDLAIATGKTDIRSGYQQLSHVFGGALGSVSINVTAAMIDATINNIEGALFRIEAIEHAYAADLKDIELEASPIQIMKDIQEKLRPFASSPHAIVF